jgi:hypothetical protein
MGGSFFTNGTRLGWRSCAIHHNTIIWRRAKCSQDSATRCGYGAVNEKEKMTRQQLSEPSEWDLEDSEDEAHTERQNAVTMAKTKEQTQ